MSRKYTPLAETTLGGSSGAVTFGSIPAGYRDLMIVVAGATSGAVGVALRFNSDSGSNYSFAVMDGYGSGSGSASSNTADTSLNMGVLGAGQNNTIFHVFDYLQTKHKTAINRTNSESWGGVRAGVGRWGSTAAVTTVQVFTNGVHTFSAGTTFSLYGVK